MRQTRIEMQHMIEYVLQIFKGTALGLYMEALVETKVVSLLEYGIRKAAKEEEPLFFKPPKKPCA